MLRSDLSGNPTFRELLDRVRHVALEAYEHQDLPFEMLVEELDPERELSRNPLFQVAFALQNAPMQRLELPGVTLEPVSLEAGTTRFDLEVHLWEPAHGLSSLWQSQAGLSGFVSYSTDLFDRTTIARLVGHFQMVFAGIIANPNDRLSDLPLLTPGEWWQLCVDWQRTSTEYRGDRGFHHLFEVQVQQSPDAMALVTEQGSLTYRQLNQQADRLAKTLWRMGVQPHDRVGLCVDRSAEMVIAIVAIFKAGGAYVPLDPNYPRDRLQFMLADTQVGILLTQSWLVERLPTSQAQVLCLDRPLPEVPHREIVSNVAVTADHLAYVIYTSGSTGTPKGVLLSHRGLCNVVEAQRQVFHLSWNSRVLQFSSLSFDASIFEIALAVGSGGTLYIPPKSAQLPGTALIQFLQNNAITHALLTPTVLAVLPSAALPALQMLITGGEACSQAVVDRWAVDRQFFNAYGPTETTIWATVAELHPGDNPLTIGRPILNTSVYILDAALNPVPVGIPGELYIGGVGLAQGYLNRPELTTERFIDLELPILDIGLGHEEQPNPKSKIQNPKSLQSHRVYKTGDRARYRNDGTIEFLGRVDNQIKIRGFRVELGEIEATLQRHPAVQDAIVLTNQETMTDSRLIAYFSLNHQQINQSGLEQSLELQQIQHWQTLYNQTYQPSTLKPQPSSLSPQSFNIIGWNSSYTGQPIPLQHMQEWMDDRVRQILALKPQRVLEIGCGTGLLLFQIAPHCREYWGTDFSVVSLAAIQSQLPECSLPHVKLLHQLATDFTGIEWATFDVVILNSVVQYFPSQAYLMQVLEGATRAVAPGGVLFVGDVRSFPLLNAFHSWVQFSQAESGLERTRLRRQVERSRFEEPELAIDPAFFCALRERFPFIQQVQIRLSRGRSQNEMTQFRYNILLRIQDSNSNELQTHVSQSMQGVANSKCEFKHGDAVPPFNLSFNLFTHAQSIQWHDWRQNLITVADVQKHLLETEPELFGMTNIANRRINAAVKITNWLFHETTPGIA